MSSSLFGKLTARINLIYFRIFLFYKNKILEFLIFFNLLNGMLLVWCLRKIAILNFGNIWMSFYADEDHSSDERKRENDDQEQNHTSTCLNRIIDDDSLPGRVFLDFTFSDSSFSVSSGSSMGCSRWSWCFECWLWRFIYRIMVLNIYKAKTRTMNGFLRDEFSSHKWSPPSRSSVASFICEASYSITGMKKFMECGTKYNFIG